MTYRVEACAACNETEGEPGELTRDDDERGDFAESARLKLPVIVVEVLPVIGRGQSGVKAQTAVLTFPHFYRLALGSRGRRKTAFENNLHLTV